MRYQPGQSGNPGGRPRNDISRELARQHTEAAIATLVAALDSPRERVAAAVALLNRGWGMPTQALDLSGAIVRPEMLSDAELLAIATGCGEADG